MDGRGRGRGGAAGTQQDVAQQPPGVQLTGWLAGSSVGWMANGCWLTPSPLPEKGPGAGTSPAPGLHRGPSRNVRRIDSLAPNWRLQPRGGRMATRFRDNRTVSQPLRAAGRDQNSLMEGTGCPRLEKGHQQAGPRQ